MPGLTRLLGYGPTEKMGLGRNIPRGAAEEWMKWVNHPQYMCGDPETKQRMEEYTVDTATLSFDDDGHSPKHCICRFCRVCTANVPVEAYPVLEPSILGNRPLRGAALFRDRLLITRLVFASLNAIVSQIPKPVLGRVVNFFWRPYWCVLPVVNLL